MPRSTGLGLSIVRALLRRSAGTIELADGIGGRSLVVTISLPKHH
jgi:signal transduction histidine kinase